MVNQHHLTTLGATLSTLSALLLSVATLQADPPAGVHSDALRGYWSFDAVTSTQAEDLSGFDHHADLLLTTQAIPGYFGGGGLSLDTDAVLSLDNSTGQLIADNLAPFTITFWVRFDTLPAASTVAILESEDLSLFIGADGITGELLFGDFFNNTFLSSTDLMSEAVWHHIGLTYDGTDATLYLDGEEQSSITALVEVNSGLLLSGAASYFGDYLLGELDELRIHSEALTAQQIALLASLIDTDGNGIDDNWEEYYFSETGIDPDADADGDGLSNRAEFIASTNPTNPDTDGDGIKDGWEATHGLNPRSDTDAAADPDGDGYTNLQEYRLGRNPRRPAIPDTTGLVNLVVNRPL